MNKLRPLKLTIARHNPEISPPVFTEEYKKTQLSCCTTLILFYEFVCLFPPEIKRAITCEPSFSLQSHEVRAVVTVCSVTLNVDIELLWVLGNKPDKCEVDQINGC